MKSYRKFLRWILYTHHSVGEIYLAILYALITAPTWTESLDPKAWIVALLIMILTFYHVTKLLFSSNPGKPEDSTLRLYQIVGMVIIITILVANLGIFPIFDLQYSWSNINEIFIAFYATLISLRAFVLIASTFLVYAGVGYGIAGVTLLGLSFFTFAPKAKYIAFHSMIMAIILLVATLIFWKTSSLFTSFIYGVLLLDIIGAGQESLSMSHHTVRKSLRTDKVSRMLNHD